jgi:hypothetical protein
LYGVFPNRSPGFGIRRPNSAGGELWGLTRQLVGGSNAALVDFADMEALAARSHMHWRRSVGKYYVNLPRRGILGGITP